MITRPTFDVRITCLLLFLLLAAIEPTQAQLIQTRSKPFTASQIAQRVIPSVVVITVKNSVGNIKLGTGFFIEPDVIATNYHLLKGAVISDISVRLIRTRPNSDPPTALEFDREELQVSNVIGVDEDKDLALLWVKRVGQRPLKLAIGKHSIGDTIYVVGNPKGFEGTFSQGVISGFRSSSLVQISAPISPGSSGGPVLDNFGEVVGIIIGGIPDAQNLNFARSAQEVLAFEKRVYLDSPRKGWLDLSGIDLSVFREKESPEKEEPKIPPVRSGVVPPLVSTPKLEWEPVYLTDESIYLMNMNERSSNEGITRAWVKEISLSNKDKKEKTITLDDYKSSPHKLVLYQCDCKRRLMLIAMFVEYDGNGNATKSADLRKAGIATWSEVAPDSMGQSIFNAACKN